MSASKLKNIGLAMLVLVGAASVAKAQLDDPHSPFYGPSNDMRFFEPVELDLDGRGCWEPYGFFFSYDHTYWGMTGEKTEVGDEHEIVRAFSVWGGNPLDPTTGQPIEVPLFHNSITDAVPQAEFDFGQRYEFGYIHEDQTGWLFGVLDGGDHTQGFTIGTNGGFQEGSGGLQSPLGDVFVNIRAPIGYFAGFADYKDHTNADETVGASDSFGDGVADGGQSGHDDIDEDGQHGGDGFDVDEPAWVPDARVVGILPDYDDLIVFPVAFRLANVRNRTEADGIEIMRTFQLSNDHWKVKHQNQKVDVFYGVRYLLLDDNFLFEGFGGDPQGDSLWDTTIKNNIIGPQFGYRWAGQHGRWMLSSQGRALMGFNVRNWRQDGFWAEDMIPGQENTPLYGRAVSFNHGKTDYEFSPVGELRLDAEYRLTDNISLKLGWTGSYVGGIRRAGNNIDYQVHTKNNGEVFGFRDAGNQQLFYNGVNFGIEITQ